MLPPRTPTEAPFDAQAFGVEHGQLEARVLAHIGRGAGSFDSLALDIFRFQYRWNESYRKFCDLALGPCGPGSVARPAEIPAVPTAAFKFPGAPLATFPPEMAGATFRTSGTTGEARGHHHFWTTTLYRASVQRGWDAAALPRHPVLALTPPPHDAPNSSLVYMLDELAGGRAERFFGNPDGTPDLARLREAVLGAGGPVVLAGTALAILHLAEQGASPLPLSPGSTVFETGGYKGSGRTVARADLYGLIGELFGVPPDNIVNEYSMTELSSQFYARGPGAPHAGPPWARAQVLDPESGSPAEDGATGYLQILDLANLGSVVAVATRDMAVRRGDRFELLGRDPAALPRGCSRQADERFLATLGKR